MMKYLQRLGKSLMLPVAVLPAAAILMGIGYFIDSNVMTGLGDPNALSLFLVKAGGAIIENMSYLFAVGVALGMSKDKDGSAALSGLVAFLIVTTVLSSATVAGLTGKDVADVPAAFGKINNQFIGILSGLVASWCYNKFSKVQLPAALAFFSGKRLAPIMTSVFMLITCGVLYVIWPAVYGALVAFGESIISLGSVGAGIYAFFNRLLIPTGLHHALNSVFWFDVANINDIPNFLNGTGVPGVTGIYQAGFFPIMMFGLPAAGLAMYHTAKPEKKKATGSLMMAAGFAAFLTGVTEPLEFAFMFLAPGLYLVHAVLTGISVFIAAQFQWIAGFAFSAGLCDYILSLKNPLAVNVLMLIPLGLVFAVVYYFLFRFIITKFNLKTPGREDDDVSEEEMNTSLSNNNFDEVAKQIFDALGGHDNIVSIDNCITRLRLDVKDSSMINEQAIKRAGAAGVLRPSKDSVQVIIGTQVQFVADAMKKL